MDWFEIFRAGTHTDSQGKTREWTEEDLKKIAESYDPTHHEAPIVVGHPKEDAPAYGWIEALKTEGGKLLAKPKQLVEEFRDWVNKGLYKKVSVAIYPDMTLRHVGFLGATPPAVKGLAQAQFSDKEAILIDIEKGSEMADKSSPDLNPDGSFKGGFEGCVQHFMDVKGLAEDHARALCAYIGRQAGKIHSEQQDAETRRRGEKQKGGEKMNKFAEFLAGLKALIGGAEKDLTATPPTEAEIRAQVAAEFAEKQKVIDADTRKREDMVIAREKTLKEQEAKARKDGIAAFCESLLKAGKLTPAVMKMGLQTFLENISEIQTSFEFGEPDKDGKKPTATPLEFMENLLTGLPKAIVFGEVAGRGKEGPASGGTAGEKLDAITRKKMEEKKLDFSSAFAEAQKENPELAQEVAAELGEIRGKK